MFVSRATLQALSQGKIDDAALLLRHNRCSNAYYLAGYALELGFKAAACKLFLPECLPDRNLVSSLYSSGHDLKALPGLAGLGQEFEAARKQDPNLTASWSTASQWSVSSRYEMIDEFRAVEMVNAVADQAHGVLSWLKKHW
jgi:hypothetical protein